MDILGITGIPVIAVICYLIGAGLKAWNKFDDRKIPILMMICGCALGIAAFYTAPTLMVADEVYTAAAVGIASGALATCVNQVIKQSQKGDLE